MSARRTAQLLHERGYRPVSVAPPDAEISPKSGLRPESLGKAPAVQNGNGLWHGYNWLSHEPSAADAVRYDTTGANIGVRADEVPGLDVDVTDADLAERIQKLAHEHIGPAPVRIGRDPKRLLSYRLSGPSFSRVALRLPDGGCVEWLPKGRQYLVAGTHPSGVEYRWLRKPLWEIQPLQLTPVTAEGAEAFLVTLRDTLGGEIEGRASTAAPIPQDDLLAPSMEDLRAVVEATPNDLDGRDDYILYGHAVKAAAGPENEDEGYEIFAEWCDRWEGGNDPEVVREDWRRMRAPYRVGWHFLVDVAPEDSDAKIRACRAVFDADPDYVEPEPKRGPLDRLNDRYAFLTVGGVSVIWDSEAVLDPSLPHSRGAFLTKQAFLDRHSNQTVPVQKGDKTVPTKLGTAWMEWSGRRDLKGVGFYPNGDVPEGWLNTGHPFPHQPNTTGSCDLFLKHTRDHICAGNEEAYEYLLDMLAHLVQRPEEKPPVAVALRSAPEGVGKDEWVRHVGMMAGAEHFQSLTDSNQLFGRFNAHLERLLVVNCEDWVWAGNPQQAGQLRSIISQDRILVDQKNIPIRSVACYFRLFLTSNAAWVAAIAKQDRRWLVLDVPRHEHTADRAWFAAMREEMESGGYGRLLQILSERKLPEHGLGLPPTTAALIEQAEESLDAFSAWWLNVIDEGDTGVLEAKLEEDGRLSVPLNELTQAYNLSLRGADRTHRQIGNPKALTRRLTDLGVQHETVRPNVTEHDGTRKRVRLLVLPTLAECRAAWSAVGRGARQEWDGDDNWIANGDLSL